MYTNVSFVKFNHPYKEYYSYKENKKKPCVVYVPTYDTCSLNEFYRNFYMIHGENGHMRRMNPNKTLRRFIKSKYKQDVKKFIAKYKKYGEDVDFIPRIKPTRSAQYYL